MKKFFSLKRMFILLLYPVSVLLVVLARLNNGWVEHFFVPYIYTPLSYAVGTFVSLFPFSVTELFVVVACLLSLWYIVRQIIQIVNQKGQRFKIIYKLVINILCTGAVALFLFEICMGLNYYRVSASEYLGLKVEKSTPEQLYKVCKILVNDLNESRKQMQTDQNGVAILSDNSRFKTSVAAQKAYADLQKEYPFLKGASIKNKPLASSQFFSYFLTTGIYFPYTFESNINVAVPQFTIPATMCHELTHSRGFMREEEANFLGYLACLKSERADFNYSGSLMAFDYCFAKLYEADKTLATKIAYMCDSGVITDINAQSAYWQKYIGTPISQAGDAVYDSYLQANGQSSGVKSYGLMVDLLIAYYK